MAGFFEQLQSKSIEYRTATYNWMNHVSGLGRANDIAKMVSFQPDYNPGRDNGSTAALATIAGAGFTAGAMCIPTPVDLTDQTTAILQGNIVGLYMAGVSFVGMPILYTTLYSFYKIGLGLIKNREELWDPCTNLELAYKFMSILTDPILSGLCAVTQLLYSIGHLLMTPMYLCTAKFDQAEISLNKMGMAYLEIFNHLTSACVSPLINLTDFTIHAGQSIFCNNSDAGDKLPPEEGRNLCGLRSDRLTC